MNSKEYKVADGRTVVFKCDENGIGKITLECMDLLMGMIPQWIPCSERLPSEEHNLEGFLTTVRCYDESDVFIQVYENGKFGHWDGEKLIPNDDVIAWMPLPEPMRLENES